MRTAADASDGQPMTLEEFRRMPEDDAYRLELSRGRLVKEPRPGAEHGWLTGRLVRLLGVHAEERELGIVVTETGFLLEDGPPTLRGPDAAFIAADRIAREGIPGGFWTVAPDLAVEVISPSNSAGEIRQKVLEYLEAGTRLVWVVDPASRSVGIWSPSAEARLLREGDVLEGGTVLPGFRLEVASLFRR